MKESALNSLAISTIETWSARTRKNSNISAWLAKIVIAAVLAPYIFPMATSLEWKTQYTYANEYHPLELAVPIRLESPKNSFVVELQTESSIADEHAVTFKIFTDTSEKETDLEIMGDETEQGRYFTAPQHFEPSKTIRVECIGCKSLKKPILHLVALDTRTSVEKLSYNPDALVPKSYATISAFPVISRADWGADESLRYADSEIWKKIFKDQSTITPSDAALKIIEKNTAIEAKLREKFPEESKINEVVRKEKGHELVWPIEKTKYVREMVVHHTGEDNLKSLSDLELMRSIYYYHSVVRGWGDIGYQYVVGQRGQVYEGRAGWDYAVGAHVSWNNRGVVGISVIGNFEKDVLVKEQKQSLEKFLTVLSQKYGINTNTTITGHRACKVSEECLTRDFDIKSLVGHRDVGFTSCPGTNLYAELTNNLIPKLNKVSKNNILVANTVYKPETLIKPTSLTKPKTNIGQPTPNVPENFGPMIRIRLSVPKSKTLELEATEWTPILGWNNTSGKIAFNKISVRKVGTKVETTMGGKKYKTANISLSATIVRINNWARIPAWDQEKKYNDNEFRGKLDIFLEDGKLVVVNELPLEMYLRGLAEFSTGENSEKAKTILVAARSYALFYVDKNNRKFPGKKYDGSDDPDVFQKYLGYGYEKRSPTTIKYAKETKGEIITYKEIPVKPWYFSQSNGKTLSAYEYCEARKTRKELPATTACVDIPYLQSVADPGGAGKTRLGHGVGISGIGATYFATTKGWDYKKIIQYYLKDTEVFKKY